jgi:hypothetical protein
VSHLNEQLSALVDGELTGTELDRVNAHLAACEQCRAEAAALRLLKRELRNLAATRPSEELTSRLLLMAGPGGPVQSRRPGGLPPPRPAFRTYPGRPGPGPGRAYFAERAFTPRPAPPVTLRPGPHSPADPWSRRKRGRYLAVGALSFVVTVGIGAAALALGGSNLPAGTRMTPQMELYSIAHAITGTIPMVEPGKIKPAGTPHTP